MKDHAQFADALALYAMGALDDRQELAELEAHLGTCGECRRELESLRADMGLLALSTSGPQPPQRAKARLMLAVAAEPRRAEKQRTQVVGRLRSRWFTLVPIAAAMILAIACFTLLREVQELKGRNEAMAKAMKDLDNQNRHAKEVLDVLQNPNTQRMTLVSQKAPPQPQMKTYYDREQGRVLLFASNAPPLPEDKVYELWLIPADGSAPMPAGTFSPDNSGGGMIMHQFDAQGIQAKLFAVTVEPRGGSKTPTMPIVMAPAS